MNSYLNLTNVSRLLELEGEVVDVPLDRGCVGAGDLSIGLALQELESRKGPGYAP